MTMWRQVLTNVLLSIMHSVKLGSYSQIPITAVDPDGDYVKCLHTDFHEAGVLLPAEGVDVKVNPNLWEVVSKLVCHTNTFDFSFVPEAKGN